MPVQLIISIRLIMPENNQILSTCTFSHCDFVRLSQIVNKNRNICECLEQRIEGLYELGTRLYDEITIYQAILYDE